MNDMSRAVKPFEAPFRIGQRVQVELAEIPPKERNCSIGTIIGITTRFPATPQIRKVKYLVRFDDNYIKKNCVLRANFDEMIVAERALKG